MSIVYNLEYRNHNGLLQAMVIKIKLLMCAIKVASHKLGACKMRTKKTYKWLPSKYCNIHTTMSENVLKKFCFRRLFCFVSFNLSNFIFLKTKCFSHMKHL